MAPAFNHPSPLLVPKPEPRNTLVPWPSNHRNKSLPSLPDEVQQDEVFEVRIVNHCNLNDDVRVTVRCSDAERRVKWMGQQEMAKGEHASPYSICSSAVFGKNEEDASSHHYQPGPSLRSPSYDQTSLLDGSESTGETDFHDCTSSLTSSLTQLTAPCPSPATYSTTLSSTTGRSSVFSQYECLSPPRSLYLDRTQPWDQFHTTSQHPGPEQIPSSLAAYGTVESPPHMNATGDQTAKRSTPPATTIPPTSTTRPSTQHRKSKFKSIPRRSIDLELAGYKPECGPSPLLADQATAQHVYKALRQHMSDQLKAYPNWNSQLGNVRIKERQKENRQEKRKREKLAALNAEAAQDFKVVEQALGVGPGKGRKLIPKPVYDNSAWQAPPLTSDQPNVAEAAQTRRGRKSYPSSIESVYASSPRSHTPEPLLLPSRTPSPLGNESAPSSSSGILRTPVVSEPHDISNIVVRSNGSPPRPLVHQRTVVLKQWEGPPEGLPASLTKSNPALRRSKRFNYTDDYCK